MSDLSLTHATLVVPDYDQALAFYVDRLGFDLVEDTRLSADKRWVVVAPPDGGAGLVLAQADCAQQVLAVGNQTGGRVAFFLRTDDFSTEFRRLSEAGVSFEEEPRVESYGTVAVFRDPFGTRWDLIERADNTRETAPPVGQQDKMLAAATAARAQAHAPYSNFAVGAAILCENGWIHAGCNVENVAYPQGLCAEAGAIAAMVAAGSRRIDCVLVLADAPDPVPPCGGCRQKLAEFAGPQTIVLLARPGGVAQRTTLNALLPGAFGPAHLEHAK